MRVVWLTAYGVASLLACSPVSSTDDQQSPTPPGGVPQTSSVVLFHPIEGVRSSFSLIPDRRRFVIRDEAAWRSFWRELHGNVVPPPEPPAVDFSRQMVIGASMGQRPSGGYAIDIEEIYEDGGTLFPVVLETSPGPLCTTIQVITAPVVAVLVERTGASVTFVEKTETRDCP